MYYLRLLGGLSLEGSSGPVSGRAVQRSRLALLALLGAAGDTGLSRDKLVGYLWPESDQQRAHHSLCDSLYILRKELGDDALLTVGTAVRLNPEVVSCDVSMFESALARAAPEEAVGHYGGAFLDGFHARDVPEYEHWADAERQRLAARYEDALQSLAKAAEEARDHPRAASWWRRLAAHDPYNTRFVLSLMEALAAAGDPANALHCAEEHQRVLRQEIGEDAALEFRALAESFKLKGYSAWAKLVAPVSADGHPTPVAPGGSAAEFDARAPRIVPSRQWWRLSPVTVLAVALIMAAGGLTLASAGRWLPLRSAESATISVAVLPFENTSGDPENDYFSDGVTLELINKLAPLDKLRIIPQASAFSYKGQPFDPKKVARELEVDAVVIGTLARYEDELSIGVALVDVGSHEQLWGYRYDRSVEDIFDIESDIVRSIVAALGLTLSDVEVERLAERRAQDPKAYEYYLKGTHLSSFSLISDWAKAIEYLEQSVARDPTFAPAYSALAYVYVWSAYVRPPMDVYRQADVAVQRALQIDESLGEAHAVRGLLMMYRDWDWEGAEEEFERAMELNPNSSFISRAYADYLMVMGRFDEAIVAAQHRLMQDPLAPDAYFLLGVIYRLAGRYDEAIDAFQKQLELYPASGLAAGQLALVYSSAGMMPEAIAQAERAEPLLSSDPDVLPLLAITYAVVGRRTDALRILEAVRKVEAERYFDPIHIAAIYDALGDIDEAILWYSKGFEERSPDVIYGARTQPEPWHHAKSDPRYQELVARVGFP